MADSDRIGAILLQQGRINSSQLSRALRQQKKLHRRLGEILIGLGVLSPFHLAKALARQQNRPYINLLQHPPEASLLSPSRRRDYLHFRTMPWRTVDGRLIIVTADPACLPAFTEQFCAEQAWEWALTSPDDIRWTLSRLFRNEDSEEARFLLDHSQPDYSARQIIRDRFSGYLMITVFTLLLLAFIAVPTSLVMFMLALNGLYLGALLFKTLIFMIGIWTTPASPRRLPDDASLPVYTVLVPLFREHQTLPQTLASIRALDYPKSKLDVKLIIEESDPETLREAKRLHPEHYIDIITVPDSQPRTKPKAMNYALRFARGDYVTIYDAEDIPDPLQLRKAVHAFRQAPDNVACFQARLNYYNRNEALLTRLFAIEYAAWFDYMLEGLQALKMPLPLGGTSNHIRMDRLREAGLWDPFNVTEDADLGIRLAAKGYKTAVLPSLTLEEAPLRLGSWLRQRSRWIKGYMQTWIVHMRHPGRLYHQLGFAGFTGFQLFIGGPCLMFLTTPVLWIIALLWAIGILAVPADFKGFFLWFAIFNLLINMIIHAFFAVMVIARARWRGMALAVFAFPLYWLLHSVASFKALWQLIFRPHYWEKTDHARTLIFRRNSALERLNL